MGKPHAPRRGSLQFWPRVRAKREAAYVRRWPTIKEAKPLGFLGYKVGMCHVQAIDNRPKALTKGEEVSFPATILECPPLKVIAAEFYKQEMRGMRKVCTILSVPMEKELTRLLSNAKKTKRFEDVKEFDDVRLLVATQPVMTGIGSKKPKIAEVAIGGTKEQKLSYAKDKLGKEILVTEVFGSGNIVDIHAITKGKGFQGPVKRHGVMLRHHKSEKARRGNIRGSWTGPSMWTAPHSARMGYNQRVEYNKQLLKIGEAADFVSSGGFLKYGVVKNMCVVVKGSIGGSRKRVVTFTHPIRPNKKITKEAPAIKVIVT